MNKAQLIDAIAAGANMTKADAGKALGAMMGTVTSSLKKGEGISLPGLGKFSVVSRKARKGRNPRTGEPMSIKAKKVVKFKPSSKLAL
jgi:DNA-binding protein HU-beta